jgi:hypothetical protein
MVEPACVGTAGMLLRSFPLMGGSFGALNCQLGRKWDARFVWARNWSKGKDNYVQTRHI